MIKNLNILISALLIFIDYSVSFSLNNKIINSCLLIVFILFYMFGNQEKNLKLKLILFPIFILLFLATGIEFPLYIVIYKILCDITSCHKVFKDHLILSILFFVLLILLSRFNVLKPNLEFFRKTSNGIYIERKTLGFNNPNAWGIYYFQLYFGLTYLLKKYKYISSMLGLILAYFMYLETNSRTSFYVIVLYFVLFILSKSLKKIKKLLIFLPLFLITTSLYLSYNYNFTLKKIDRILSNRISFSNIALQMYEFKFFSRYQLKIPIDNSFMYYYISYGFIVTLLFLFFMLYSVNRLSLNDYKYIPFIITLLFYSLSENLLVNYQGINFFNIILAISFIKKERRKTNEEINKNFKKSVHN